MSQPSESVRVILACLICFLGYSYASATYPQELTVCMRTQPPRCNVPDAEMTVVNSNSRNYLKVSFNGIASNPSSNQVCANCSQSQSCSQQGAPTCVLDLPYWNCDCHCTVSGVMNVGPLSSNAKTCNMCSCNPAQCTGSCDNLADNCFHHPGAVFCDDFLTPSTSATILAISVNGTDWEYYNTPLPVNNCGSWHSVSGAAYPCMKEICCTASASTWPE